MGCGGSLTYEKRTVLHCQEMGPCVLKGAKKERPMPAKVHISLSLHMTTGSRAGRTMSVHRLGRALSLQRSSCRQSPHGTSPVRFWDHAREDIHPPTWVASGPDAAKSLGCIVPLDKPSPSRLHACSCIYPPRFKWLPDAVTRDASQRDAPIVMENEMPADRRHATRPTGSKFHRPHFESMPPY